MNRMRIISVAGFVILLAGLFILVTCDYKNPTDDLKLILNVDPVKTTISLDFVDAGSQSTMDDVTIRLSFEGQHKDAVVDLGHEPITGLQVADGFCAFGFDSALEPSEGSPLIIVLIAQASGYVSTSMPLVIGTEGPHIYTFAMVKKDNPPSGVSTASQTGSASGNGSLSAGLNVSTVPGAGSNTSANVVIPQGTMITDASGRPLSGPLTVDITHYNGTSLESLSGFPGGFAVQIDENENGQSEEAAFITAGFAAVEVTDGSGHEAAHFDPPIQITIGIDPSTINPETGSPVQVGDKIKIWSYDNQTGAWTYEAEGTVVDPPGSDALAIVYSTNHLSWWNLDWKWDSCWLGVRVNIMGKTACDPCLYFVMEGPGFVRRLTVCDDFIQFYRVPSNIPVTLKAYSDYWHTQLVGEMIINDLCMQGVLTFDVNLNQNGFNRVFHFKGVCPDNDQVEVRPSLPLYVRAEGSTWWRYLGWIVNGEITICNLPVPGRYYFGTYFQGTFYKAAVDLGADYTVFLPEYSQSMTAVVSGNHIYYTVIMPHNICSGL
ncbi:hypothetical protein JW948_17755 [bacterium]|nr:hypothetical protein [bacterium]